jgi:3'-phosphoadenosine 5'-phosphosulfate sulfotransferase (PAPS reductase)/FAD synthetase
MTQQYVAFSGGKDSTALALLFPDAIPIFTDTGWEHQPVYDHIDRFEQMTGREVVRIKNKQYPGGIPEYIQQSKFFPNHAARYCTRMFKIEPMNEYLSERLPAELLIGLRADEPADQRTGNLTEIDGLTIRYPMREQGITLRGVLRVCTDHDLLPRYPAYMARGGCIGCFYKRKAQIIAMAHLSPDETSELQRLEESVQDERGKFFHVFGNVGMSIADIKKQPLLFTEEETFREVAKDKLGDNCGLFCRR